MQLLLPLLLSCLCAPLAAQNLAVFPGDYDQVPEGPLNSPNLPLANGAGRAMLFYDHRDLSVPLGATITRLGFRQDATLTALDQGRSLQLEVRMGYTDLPATAPSTTFDSNYALPAVTVFGPAVFTLPNLRDANAPLPNGQFFIPLTTPFVYQPNGRNLVVEYRVLANSVGGASFNFRLDRADFYSPVVLGPAGCPHSGNHTPQLTITPTRIGSSLTASLAQAPANSFVMMAIDLGRLAQPYPLGALISGINPACTGQVALGNLVSRAAATNASGGATVTYAIPNDLAFNDLYLSHQVACFDFFAPGGMAMSNGCEVQLGSKPLAASLSAQGPVTTATGTIGVNYCPVALFGWQ
ncbi:MAG: hypothetical protein KDC48_18005 [Planctomycetes bacterium]|nr:hypothetical protein [Planctomycetota bacterium]